MFLSLLPPPFPPPNHFLFLPPLIDAFQHPPTNLPRKSLQTLTSFNLVFRPAAGFLPNPSRPCPSRLLQPPLLPTPSGPQFYRLQGFHHISHLIHHSTCFSLISSSHQPAPSHISTTSIFLPRSPLPLFHPNPQHYPYLSPPFSPPRHPNFPCQPNALFPPNLLQAGT